MDEKEKQNYYKSLASIDHSYATFDTNFGNNLSDIRRLMLNA